MTTAGLWRLALCALLVSAGLSCKEDPSTPGTTGVDLEVIDVGASDVGLRLKIVFVQQSDALTLTRDDSTLFTIPYISHPGLDTVLCDDRLLPNRRYLYRASLHKRNTLVGITPLVEVTTTDTTSHAFTWEIFVLGDGAGSVLYDVAVINDSLIYAVGNINIRDSTGNYRIPPYNFAIWNGREWLLSTTMDSGFGYGENYCIFAFGPNDVWVGSSVPEHWDGTKWEFFAADEGYPGAFWIWKIWGTDSSNMYFVGQNGNIVHYDGTSFQKLTSATSLDVYDIWGDKNFVNGDYEIYAVAGKIGASNEKKILTINGHAVTAVPTTGIDNTLHGLWFAAGRRYYVVGDGVFSGFLPTSDSPWRPLQEGATGYYLSTLRGKSTNDLIACGAFGELLHYNGVSWRSYRHETGIRTGALGDVSYRGQTVACSGYDDQRGIIAIGRR